MRGDETVRIIPTVVVDRLRSGSGGLAQPAYDLEDCYVIPRATEEQGKGVVGIEGYDIYYFGTLAAPPRTAQVSVRGQVHDIEGKPRDFIVKGRRKGLIITTSGVA